MSDSKKNFRTKESMGGIMLAWLDTIATWEKKDALISQTPQRVEDGVIYNFKNTVIGGCDGDDIIFHEDDSVISERKMVTAKLVNDLRVPLVKYFMADVNDDKEVEEEEEVPTHKHDDEGDYVETLLEQVKGLIAAGDLKKAKKLLKKNEDAEDFKAAKKLYKKAK